MLKILSSKEEYYTKAYKYFISQTTEQDVSLKWWKQHIPDIVRSVGENSSEYFRVLAVGTSNGKPFDEELLDILCTVHTNIIYTVVEPSVAAVEQFKLLAESKYPNVQFEWFPITFEEFQENELDKDNQRFNLIHFVHSIYYISASSWEMLRESLIPCFNSLKEEGAMIFHMTDQSGKRIFLNNSFPLGELYYETNVVGRVAEMEGWKATVFNENWKANLTPCFDQNSEVGNMILDFLSQTRNFRGRNDEKKVKEAMKFLESQSELMEDGSRIAYPMKLDITVIRKM